MSNFKENITVIGKTNFHNKARLFGIKLDDRRRHIHIIGKTGMGKSSLMLNMAVADILNGHGMALIDPHGDLAEYLLDCIPPERMEDVIYFNPQDLYNPIGFNVLGDVPKNQRHIVADGLVGVFKKIWADSWGPRLEYILRNAILALLESDESTLLDIMRILVDKDFRAKIVYKIEDPIIKSFWLNEFEGYGEKMQAEAVAPIQNKVGQFTSSPLIRNIIGQKKSSFNIREVMDQGKILIMNLSKGAVGEGGAQLLGAMMVTKMQMAAMSRVDIPQEERKDFFAYIDEFQNFSTDSFAEILSEARKYRLALVLAHQYIEQLPETVQSAVFGNVGTTIMFRIGAGDAERFEKEVAPVLTVEDLVSLPKWKIYIKLMIDGVTSAPFSADTLPDPKVQEISLREQIIEFSSKTYGVPIAKLKEESEANSFSVEPQKNNNSNSNPKQNNRPNYQNNRQGANRPNYQKSNIESNKTYSNNYSNKSNLRSEQLVKEDNSKPLQTTINDNKLKESVSINQVEPKLEKEEQIKQDVLITDKKPISQPSQYLSKDDSVISKEIIDEKRTIEVTKDNIDNKNSYKSLEEESPRKVESLDNNLEIASIEKNISSEDKVKEPNLDAIDLEYKQEVQNPILARKLKEIFSKSQNPFGVIEYNVKSNVLKREYDKGIEERLSDDNLVVELLDEFSQKFMEKKVQESDLDKPKLIKFRK